MGILDNSSVREADDAARSVANMICQTLNGVSQIVAERGPMIGPGARFLPCCRISSRV